MIPSKRLLSLDVFRGMIIATMILVNTIVLSPYPMLNHSEWHGCTVADIVFPLFIFVLGISLVFSLSKQRKLQIAMPILLTKIMKRTLIIFGMGLLLNAVPYHMTFETIQTIRIYGVLQRIALCYLLASIAYITLSTYLQIGLTVLLLVGYYLIMTYLPLPYYGPGDLTAEGNVSAYLDRILFHAEHLYGKVYDPEGLFSTLPAIATALLGNLTGIWLLSKASQTEKLVGMVVGGTVFLMLGWYWGLSFPINKALWTSSFVLWTGGLALLGFAICYWLIEMKQVYRWSKSFEIFGLNAIIAYFGHVLLFKLQLMIPIVNSHGVSGNLRTYIIQHLFGWATLPYASLLYGMCSVLFWLLILAILYSHKLFIRI